mgnify:CR=1 FL=1
MVVVVVVAVLVLVVKVGLVLVLVGTVIVGVCVVVVDGIGPVVVVNCVWFNQMYDWFKDCYFPNLSDMAEH